ncbi:PAS domain S-box protein [Fodinibius sp.]|uniref:PAS domain S-box protein n=1 Tax=Fodinibius sp. TaxID=1872440 RepID=UPI002ACED6F8|nr:PAS domain S-box protein [Fodinibius sp.]MDZ7658290.1 PAS domain S-box protein [Fodinibius sp.]
MPEKTNDISLSPLKITVIYLIVAALWIAFTDRLVESLVSDTHALSILQTYKGWFYVFLTGAGLYWLIKKHDQQLQTKEVRLENLLADIQSEKELKDVLFERIPVLITIYDPDLETFEVNKEFEKVIGWSNEEIEEQEIDLLEACYPDFDTREEAVQFMNSPGVGWREIDTNTKSGQKIPISWTNVRLTDNTSVGIGIDMTDIKASQAKMRKSREMLKKIFESMQSSLIILDFESRTIVDCNESTEEMFGYSKEELEGSSTRMLHVSDETFEEFGRLSDQPLLEKGVFQTEFQMQRKDGTIFHSDHTVTLVYDEDGEIDKVVSAVRDITEQKEYQQKLERRQERLQRSQEIGEIGDWELNTETEDIYWSTMMYEIFERDPELGPPTFEELQTNYYQEQSKKHNRAVQKAVDDGQLYDIDLLLQTDQGNKKYIRTIGIPVKDESGNVIKLRGIIQDITERKQVELALSESKERIQNITDNVPGVVFRYIFEQQGSDKLEFVSKGAQKIWGVTPEEAQNNNSLIWQKIHPSDIDRVQQSIQESAQTLNTWNEEWRYIMPDGSLQWQNGIGIPSKKQDGSIVWDSIILDITERKNIEQELSKEKQRFQLVAKTTSDVIWDLDLTDDTIWWSKGFEKHFGYKLKQLADDLSSWTDHIHPEDKKRATESLQKALDSKDKFWEEQYRFIRADNSIAHIVDRGIIMRDEKGEATRMVGTLNDITERKKAEQKLKESEEKYRHIFENNPEPMWIYDPDTLEFMEVNQAAVDHYGYSEQEFLNISLTEIRPAEDIEKLKNIVDKHRSDETYSGEWRHHKKDGTLIYVEITATNIQYRESTFRLALIHDITEQKRMQEKIIQSVIEGEDRERKRIAHELHDGLGQYLVAASMNLQSAKSDIDKLSKKRQNQFETGISLLKNALSETRSIAHNLMPQAISDYGLIAALKNLINNFSKSTNINFQFNHNCDELRLNDQAKINIYRIFQEIITNAIRHAECSKIDIQLQLKDDSLKLMAKDNGIGTQLDELDEEAGLGLRSIKTRVSSLKGSLDIESEPGEGMQTIITIPHINHLKSNNSDHG